MPKDPKNAVLVERADAHAGLSVFGVKLKDGSAPAFLPGQYATLGIQNAEGKLVRRAYSVASAPGAAYDADGVLRFYVVKVDGARSRRRCSASPSATSCSCRRGWAGTSCSGRTIPGGTW